VAERLNCGGIRLEGPQTVEERIRTVSGEPDRQYDVGNRLHFLA